LRLGQGEGTDLTRWVLRGDHEERFRQRPGLAFGGHLPLFHRLEQGALRLRGGAVDFVRQQNLTEDRSGQEAEIGPLAVEDHPARDELHRRKGDAV